MKKLALAALLVATGLSGSAVAQYQGPPGVYYGPTYDGPRVGGRGYDGPRGGRGDYDGPRRGYDRGRDDAYDGRRGARRGSSVCVTGRGSCPIGGVVPRMTPCRCDIPGFGLKRGNAA
ncbi:hypothetical protein [uncultured Enterovirga sp.]|uniref:hypothetical protein n=1 Tax=uncultured Enterovirga sp. TaxID=2026352 RepID=UPI0035C997F0